MPEVQEIVPGLTKVHYWTDSPTSQYRNKTIFHAVDTHREIQWVPALWNYFEAGHGKSACDGVGSTSKHLAQDAVKQGKVEHGILTAADYYKWASSSNSSIAYRWYSGDDYKATQTELKSIGDICPIKGTFKIHSIRSSHHLFTRDVSCYKECCLLSPDPACGWQEVHLTVTPSAPPSPRSEASEHAEMSAEMSAAPEPNTIQFKTNMWVGAKWENIWYPGKYLGHVEDGVQINFMSPTEFFSRIAYEWPKHIDKEVVPVEDVVPIDEPMPTCRSNRCIKFISACINQLNAGNE